MRPEISDDLQHVDDSRKTAIIARLNVSIAALQRTRHASSGSLREENYTFFWNGKEPDKPRLYGVGFAVRNSLMASVEPQTGGTERILSIGMATAAGVINIFSVYAPTLGTSDDIKDHFYDELDTQIARIPQTGPVLILGDFNARVGSDTQSWPSMTVGAVLIPWPSSSSSPNIDCRGNTQGLIAGTNWISSSQDALPLTVFWQDKLSRAITVQIVTATTPWFAAK